MIKLLAQALELQEAVERFAETIESETRLLLHFISIVQHHLKSFSAHAAAVEDDTTLMWIFAHTNEGFKISFTPIQAYLHMIERGTFGDLTPLQNERISRAVQRVNAISRTMINLSAQAIDLTASETSAPSVVLPADSALAVLWPILRYAHHETGSITISILSNLPCIVYHRWHTTELFESLLLLLTRQPSSSGHIRIDAQPMEASLAMHLRVQGLLMSPLLWEQMLLQVRAEHLHELGGYIEPLVWDEGEGQGVTVYLPWATSAR